MKKSDALKQERASKIEAQGNLITQTETEKRAFSETETAEFNNLDEEIRALDIEIEQALKIEAAQKRAAEQAAPSSGVSGTTIQGPQKKEGNEAAEKRKILARASISRAISRVSSGLSLEGAEKEMSEIAVEESRLAGVPINEKALLHIPMSMLRATAHTVTEDSGNFGGQLVHNDAPKVFMPFAPKTFLEKLGATRWTSLKGNVPLVTGNNYDFQWLAETAAITVQKQQFDGGSLSPKRLGAAVEISNQLLIQSSVDVEATVRGLLFAGYDRAINAAAINGAGGLEPTGLLNTVGIQESTTVVATPATRAMIIELQSLIEIANATEDSLGYLMSPGLKASLQNTKVDAGSGLFLLDAGPLLGYKVVTSTLVPELASNQVMIFGDWSKLYIGEWGSMSVLSDPYSASLSNSVRLVVNAHADVAIAQPEAFAVNKFLEI